MHGTEKMKIDWDVPIEMDDGGIARADVFRPVAPGRYPVILSHGVYGKGLPIERFRHRLFALSEALPDNVIGADLADTVDANATDTIAEDDYRVWEVVDPTQWVPRGYVCVRVDSRGSGASPGYLDPLSPREIDDYAACIEWAGTQEWSNGRVGLSGKSYYAMTQWLVAARRPPHLAAICVWHGLSDWYRDATRHGGILYQFWEKFWYPQLALPVQNGLGPQAGLNPHSGHPIAGQDTQDVVTLAAHRVDLVDDIRQHPFVDDYYRQRTPQLDQVTVPVLASADWSDHDLHLRGTIRGFHEATCASKWLEIHAGGQFDDPRAVTLQQRFFDHHLKDPNGNVAETGGVSEDDWAQQPRVELAVREVDGTTTVRHAGEWPLPDTHWRTIFFELDQQALADQVPQDAQTMSYAADSDGVTLSSASLTEDTTILGPVAVTLWISSSTEDADLFLTLNAVDSSGDRVELRDHRGGLTPASIGWQRASHRALDPERSTPGQPRHLHQAAEPLIPGQIYRLDIELCPTSLHLPAGYRLQVTIRGHGAAHNDPTDRPTEIFGNTTTLHSGADTPSQLVIATVR